MVLVKPQFEAGKGKVGKGGVVRDAGIHREVLHSAAASAQRQELSVLGIIPSPLRGPSGNIEFLMWLSPLPHAATLLDQWIEEAVSVAHAQS